LLAVEKYFHQGGADPWMQGSVQFVGYFRSWGIIRWVKTHHKCFNILYYIYFGQVLTHFLYRFHMASMARFSCSFTLYFVCWMAFRGLASFW